MSVFTLGTLAAKAGILATTLAETRAAGIEATTRSRAAQYVTVVSNKRRCSGVPVRTGRLLRWKRGTGVIVFRQCLLLVAFDIGRPTPCPPGREN